MKRPGGNGRTTDDPNQLLIAFGAAQTETRPMATVTSLVSPLPPALSVPRHTAKSGFVLRLKWDFRESFPQPTDAAIDAGIVVDEDLLPQRIGAIHDAHARELIRVLDDLDTVMDARRRRVDPATGKPPPMAAERKQLVPRLTAEIERLERSWRNQIDIYEETFGPEAAREFDKAIRAHQAGIQLEMEDSPKTAPVADEPVKPLAGSTETQTVDAPTPAPATEGFQLSNARHKSRRVVARLPVPKPLPAAVAAGLFGQDERGPIRPGPAEVREITENHGERLTNLLDEQRSAPHLKSDAEKTRLSGEIQTAVQKYAEDFGEAAAAQLLAFASRQMFVNDGQIRPDGRRR